MKQFIRELALFITLICCCWALGVVINTIVFHVFFNMDKNSEDFIMNQFFMSEINKMLFIPAFFIAKYILKNEQIIL